MKQLKFSLLILLTIFPCLFICSCTNETNDDEPTDYTIIFNLMGGRYNDSTDSITVAVKRDELVSPIVPSKVGFVFGGWCSTLDEVMNSDMDFTKPINESKVVYALWQRLTVEYELNGGFFCKYSSIYELRNDFMSDYQTIRPISSNEFIWGSWGTLDRFLENDTFFNKWQPLFKYIREVCGSASTVTEIDYLLNRISTENDFTGIRLQLHAFLNQTKVSGEDWYTDDTADYSDTKVLDKVWNYYKGSVPPFFDNSKDFVLPIPHYENKVFGGWYDNSECQGEKVTFIPAATTSNQKYYALWQ